MFKKGRGGDNNIWSNGNRKIFTVSFWEKQKVLMMEMDGNGWNDGNSSMKQKAFCVQLKNRLSELMPSNIQLIRQAIFHYVDSVMKRQKKLHALWVDVQFWVKVNIENAMKSLGTTWTGCFDTHTLTPQSVQENDKYKIVWDFNIQADKIKEHRRPDMVCINKQKREC